MQDPPSRRASNLKVQRRWILVFRNFFLLFGSFMFVRSLHIITVIAFTVQPVPSSLRNGGWEEGPLRPSRQASNVRLSATRRRKGKSQKRPSLSTNHNAKASSTLGFTETTTYSPSILPADADIRKLLQNLFSVCGHLQNPDLYSPRWADHVEDKNETPPDANGNNVTLVARSDILAGTIVTLCPIHALGYPSVGNAKDDEEISRGRITVFDERVDGDYFRSEGQSLSSAHAGRNAYKSSIPLKFLQGDSAVEGKAFKYKKATLQVHVQANPGRSSGLWKGHRVTVVSNKDKTSLSPNCRVMSLPGAAPLCGIVSTRDMTRGEEITVNPNVMRSKQLSLLVRKNYAQELAELEGYLKMAYTASIQPDVFIDEEKENTVVKVTRSSSRAQDQHTTVQDPKPSFQSPFHEIDLHFPGIRYIHRDPDILVIDDFLSKEECESIMKHAESHLIPCLIKHPQTGQVMQDPSRTSTNANLPQADVPDIVDRLVRLTKCVNASYLETLQVLCYSDGQKFEPHTDGFEGPTTACGFHQSGRLVTVFCYLNTVPMGGSTVFTQLGAGRDGEKGLAIQPRQGTAVVHFPATTGLEEDTRTEHEGSETIHHKKWLLTTWMWKDPRSDPLYDESIFPSLITTADTKKKHEDL